MHRNFNEGMYVVKAKLELNVANSSELPIYKITKDFLIEFIGSVLLTFTVYGRISLAQKRIYIRVPSQAQKGRINTSNKEVIKY